MRAPPVLSEWALAIRMLIIPALFYSAPSFDLLFS